MRANERKGAWILLLIILAIGISLWITGKCVRKSSDKEMEQLIRVSEVMPDSVYTDSPQNASSVKEKSKYKKDKRSGNGKRKRRSERSNRGRMRDILADTITTAK